MSNRMIWGSDLYKGFKLDKNKLLGGAIDDILPFQMLSLEEKDADWIKAVADFYEVSGWNNVERNGSRIQKNFWLRNGLLNQNDYIVNPTNNEYYQAISWITPPESYSPLQQFYPLIPNFIDVLRGEFLKRDNRWSVETIDPMSTAEKFEQKKGDLEKILMEFAMLEKQKQLSEMGITPEMNPEEYQQKIEEIKIQLQEVEFKSRNFRTRGQQWAEKVIKIHEKKYNLHELEPDAFECGLITDREFWHIDLLDDDFRIGLLNPKFCDYHKGPNTKYVSEGDYFLWFDFMSVGDIVNKFGRKIKEEDLKKLKDIHVKTQNIMVPDYLKSHQGAYYDLSKNWSEATDLDPKMNDALLGKELVYNFMRSPNFDHNMEVDILNPVWGRLKTGNPQMFRVMRLYWRSLRRIGWLTKIERDGTRTEPQWVDENFRVTIEPEYDLSVNKEKTKDNLIYGEHIDWTWAPEWRHVMKISPDQKHTFWLNSNNTFESIYIDGAPVKFQFKGRDNPFDSLPPVEGCEFSYFNTKPYSLVDRLKPLQIIYNICMNKVPHKFLKDFGNKVAIDRRIVPQNNLSSVVYDTSGQAHEIPKDPMEDYEDRLQNSDILPYSLSRESLEGLGQPALPQVLPLSTINEAQLYFQLAQLIKQEAGEIVGITRNRMGQNKASETATGIVQGISYSETQTEKYFEQHGNLMQRFRQRMLEAAQYYSTFHETSKEVYMNEREENVFLEMEGMENLLTHYNIHLVSRANVRNALQIISTFLQNENTLDILPSSKIQALVEQSVPKLMELIRQGEIEAMQKEQAQRDHEIQMIREQREALMEQIEQKQSFEAEQNELNRQKDIEVATIRALGGIQTDNNSDSNIDAMENLDSYFRQQEIFDKRQIANDQLAAKRQSEIDKILVDREKSQNDIEKVKIQGEYALKIARENKTAAELKKKQKPKKKN